jgi:hypothetical protein
MEQESKIAFTGPGPFTLPVFQSVRAESGIGVVTVAARIIVPNIDGQISINIPMTANVADDLLSQLQTAIVKARKADA